MFAWLSTLGCRVYRHIVIFLVTFIVVMFMQKWIFDETLAASFWRTLVGAFIAGCAWLVERYILAVYTC